MKPPYGYKLVNGELVIDEYQAKVVRLMYDLHALDLTEGEYRVSMGARDIDFLLKEHKVPKIEIEGYRIEEHVEEIMSSAKKLLLEKLKALKSEEAPED